MCIPDCCCQFLLKHAMTKGLQLYISSLLIRIIFYDFKRTNNGVFVILKDLFSISLLLILKIEIVLLIKQSIE